MVVGESLDYVVEWKSSNGENGKEERICCII